MSTRTVHLVLIGGLAGTGKTELALELARLTKFSFYDKDLLNGPMVDKWLEALGSTASDRESTVYLDTVRPIEYTCLMNAARENIGLGVSTIVTAPFLKEMTEHLWRSELQHDCDYAWGQKVSIRYVWVHAAEDVMFRRLSQRRAARDQYKLQNWETYLAKVRPIRPLQPCFRIDCSEDGETEAQAMEVAMKFRLV